jgi:hypothetical protein
VVAGVFSGGIAMEQAASYEAPAILETFDALEVMGSSEGLEVYSIGCGSVQCVISVKSHVAPQWS